MTVYAANDKHIPILIRSLFSNFFVLGPVVIHPDLRVSTTSSIIFWSILGGEKGIICYIMERKALLQRRMGF